MDYILKLILLDIEDVIRMRRLMKTKIMKIKEEHVANMKIEIEYNNDKLTLIELKNQKLEDAHHINPFTTEIGWMCNTNYDIYGHSVSLIIKDKNDGGRELIVSYSDSNVIDVILTIEKISDDHYQGVEHRHSVFGHCYNEYHCFKIGSDIDTIKLSIIHNYDNEYNIGCDYDDHREFYYPSVEDIDESDYSNDQMEAINMFIKIKESQQ